MLAILSLAFLGAIHNTSWGVQRVLTNAIVGERAAVARYDAFADRADADGYLGVADLFRAEAKAERIHLARMIAVMNDRGLALPPENMTTPKVGSTAANLQAAISAELAERDDVYRDAYKTASDGGDAEVAALFDQTRDAEVEHANLCSAAARNLARLKEHTSYAVCPICGFTTDVRLSICPSCRHRMMH